MKAIVFAAGLGTRLGDFTRQHPKALVEVGGRPMLERVLVKLRDAGIDEVVVNVHHFADQIENFLADNGNFGLNLHLSKESEMLLETGGGILAASSWLKGDDCFLIHNADILTDFPVCDILDRHHATRAGATLLVAERTTSRYLLFSEHGRMEGWTNISTGAVRPEGVVVGEQALMRAFGGVHVFSTSLLDDLALYNDMLKRRGVPADSRGVCRFSIMDYYIDSCRDNDFRAYEPSVPYRWCDIGKPESLAEANSLFSFC